MEKMLRAKTLIYEQDITQIELARALKISETRLSRILNGRDRAARLSCPNSPTNWACRKRIWSPSTTRSKDAERGISGNSGYRPDG